MDFTSIQLIQLFHGSGALHTSATDTRPHWNVEFLNDKKEEIIYSFINKKGEISLSDNWHVHNESDQSEDEENGPTDQSEDQESGPTDQSEGQESGPTDQSEGRDNRQDRESAVCMLAV